MNAPEAASRDGGSQRTYWACQLAGWGMYALVRFYAGLLFVAVPWTRLALEILVLHASGLGVTHLLRWFATRGRWTALHWFQLAWRVLLTSAIAAIPIAFMTTFTAIDALNNGSVVDSQGTVQVGSDVSESFKIAVQIANWATTFVIWFVLYIVITRFREQRAAELRQSELVRALQLAELRLLKSQLNPHFLFNALNTVRSLIGYDPARAQDAVTRLANTLRYTLNSSSDELVTFAQELDIVRDYLELEAIRFEERLAVDMRVADEVLGLRIPVMLLQTVVENAIKHGIAELPSGGVVRIHAVLVADKLAIEVENPTSEMVPRRTHDGVGLRNAGERLRLLFGGRAEIQLDLSKPNIATTRISIPRTP